MLTVYGLKLLKKQVTKLAPSNDVQVREIIQVAVKSLEKLIETRS